MQYVHCHSNTVHLGPLTIICRSLCILYIMLHTQSKESRLQYMIEKKCGLIIMNCNCLYSRYQIFHKTVTAQRYHVMILLFLFVVNFSYIMSHAHISKCYFR